MSQHAQHPSRSSSLRRLRALLLLIPATAALIVLAIFAPSAAQARPAQDGGAISPVPSGVRCYDWSAWENRMPPERGRLFVTATCILPTAGHKVELRPSSPQGINPRILLLDLVVTPPKGPTLPVLTRVKLRYEQPSAGRYDQVWIMPDGPALKVEIRY